MASKVYPRALFPTPTKRRNKTRRTYWLRMARNFEHFDAHPEVWSADGVYQGKQPPYLTLPAELRQQILSEVVEDDELFLPRPNSITATLAVVCKTWAADMQEVSILLNKRERQWREETGMQREEFDCLIRDLMGPINSASNVLKVRPQLAGVKKKIKSKKLKINTTATKSKLKRLERKLPMHPNTRFIKAQDKLQKELKIMGLEKKIERYRPQKWHGMSWHYAWKLAREKLKNAKQSGNDTKARHWKAVRDHVKAEGKLAEKRENAQLRAARRKAENEQLDRENLAAQMKAELKKQEAINEAVQHKGFAQIRSNHIRFE